VAFVAHEPRLGQIAHFRGKHQVQDTRDEDQLVCLSKSERLLAAARCGGHELLQPPSREEGERHDHTKAERHPERIATRENSPQLAELPVLVQPPIDDRQNPKADHERDEFFHSAGQQQSDLASAMEVESPSAGRTLGACIPRAFA
jgi:hypothetical protein